MIVMLMRAFFILCMSGFALEGVAQLRLAKIFSDHMVMQRDTELQVWGWAAPRENISISFDGSTYNTKANKSGYWKVSLPEKSASGPYSLQVRGKETSLTLTDILVGDVWVCSGQSNMEWPVVNSDNAAQEIALANDDMIRHFKVPQSTAQDPADDLEGGSWEVTSSETVGDFTAVGYYFAKELRKHTDIPIGLLNSSWGGSRLEPWMSREALEIKSYDEIVAFYESQRKQELQTVYDRIEKKVGSLSKEEIGIVDGQAIWAAPELSTNDWGTMQLPTVWEESGYDGLDGSVWFRKTFELSQEEASHDAQLSLAMIDDSDITWVNGERVGGIEMAWDTPRDYTVPASVLKPGTNVIVVRVEDVMGGGGIYGEAEELFLQTSQQSISLDGDWKFKIGYFLFRWEPFDNQVPTILYNKMIHPLLDFPTKGVIWYQGESNANAADAYVYRDLFPKMISQWRKDWQNPEMPFLWVQLANFMAPDEQPADSEWAVLRESQSKTLAVDNTAQAVIIDIGEADDIHPTNKHDVGYRLSLGARKVAYDQNVIFSGPVYKSHEVIDNEVWIEFHHVGGGLAAKDKYGYVNGFAVAGADGVYTWAKAKIVEDKIVVWQDGIDQPVHVRYAWGNNPDDANVYNRAGLPASPFRTNEVTEK